jgi:hypothetical protein
VQERLPSADVTLFITRLRTCHPKKDLEGSRGERMLAIKPTKTKHETSCQRHGPRVSISTVLACSGIPVQRGASSVCRRRVRASLPPRLAPSAPCTQPMSFRPAVSAYIWPNHKSACVLPQLLVAIDDGSARGCQSYRLERLAQAVTVTQQRFCVRLWAPRTNQLLNNAIK